VGLRHDTGQAVSKMNLRHYQQTLADSSILSLETHSRIAVVCPTGSGKTALALHGIIPRISRPVAWVTHRVELARQVRQYGVEVSVFMIQSCGDLSGFHSIIIDEGHHVAASTYTRLMNLNRNAKIIALTATPYRIDGIGLGDCGFTDLIHGPDAYSLTVEGFLCPSVTMVPVSESRGSWSPEDCAKRIASRKFKKGITYCRTVQDCAETAQLLRARGVSACVISGEMDERDRKKSVEEFVSGRVSVVCNHSILTEGFDCPEVDLVVLNRHTESRCLWRQMTGRGLRNAKGKTKCTILDLAANSATHGSIYDAEHFSLSGSVDRTESRSLPPSEDKAENQYEYGTEEELKIWKPATSQKLLFESLQKLRSTSPLRRLLTA
jgi:superfamily II DNA or RNA helicase